MKKRKEKKLKEELISKLANKGKLKRLKVIWRKKKLGHVMKKKEKFKKKLELIMRNKQGEEKQKLIKKRTGKKRPRNN
ncbi:hypothetical protein ES708_22043 [subsurface metagenome]